MINKLIKLSQTVKLGSHGDSLKLENWTCGKGVLRWLYDKSDSKQTTVETGAGHSTVAFMLKGTNHTCICPHGPTVERIKKFAKDEFNIDSNVKFIVDKSENVVPNLEGEFDIALIDGSHSFPVTIIDWFYLGNLLKVNGYAVVDDCNLNACKLLAKFLDSDVGWELENIINFCRFYKKKMKFRTLHWTQEGDKSYYSDINLKKIITLL